MSKQWNKDIHNRLKDFPKKAPEGLLDSIKSEMSRREASAVPAPNKRPTVILRIAAVAAVILTLFGISHLFQWQKPVTLPDGQKNDTFPVAVEHSRLPKRRRKCLPTSRRFLPHPGS